MLGPDAVSLSVSVNGELIGNVGMEGGGLFILRGKYAGLSPLFDLSAGGGLCSGSVMIEYTQYYYSLEFPQNYSKINSN